MPRIKKTCSAVIVTQHTNAYNSIASVVKTVFQPISAATSIVQARQMLSHDSVDAVIINTPASDEFGIDAAIDIAMRYNVSVMVIVKAEIYDKVVYQTKGTGVMVMTRPLRSQTLMESSNLMTAMHEKIIAMAEENARLRKRLDEMSLVTRAKCLLIEKRSMTEENAHYYLEKSAMDQGLSKKEVAQHLIRVLEEE